MWDTAYVVQPYLSEPLLHNGRKWDVRTYVLVTSVLPMRVLLFTEAIVLFRADVSLSTVYADHCYSHARGLLFIDRLLRSYFRDAMTKYPLAPTSSRIYPS